MPHEIIGELVLGIAEVGLEGVGSSDDKKSALGCLTLIILMLLIVGVIYFYTIDNKNTPPQTKGLITKKLPNDNMVIKTKNGEDVYNITHELYLNKNVGDSIILNK